LVKVWNEQGALSRIFAHPAEHLASGSSSDSDPVIEQNQKFAAGDFDVSS
jgi:hypothetical protein